MKKLFSLILVVIVSAVRADEVDDYIASRMVFSNAVVRISNSSGLTGNDFTTNSFNALTYGAKFVDAANGSDAFSGSVGKPWATVTYANSNAVSGDTVYVLPGTYFCRITNSSPIWNLARGAILTNNIKTVAPQDNQNIIIRGEGDILSAGYAVEIATINSGADIEARLIKASTYCFLVSTGTGRSRLKIRNAHLIGSISAETFDLDPEILLFGVTFLGSEAAMATPYSVVSGVATNNPVNANRTGSWIVNPNVQTNPQ